jgi:S-DNA-T family DNA segregation ATPase FtsK/SpoIIIE
MASLVSQRMLFRLADRNDYSSIGLRSKEIPTFVPGRAVRADDHRVVQVGDPGDIEEVAQRIRVRWDVTAETDGATPARIASLPSEIALDEVPGAAEVGRPLRIPIGLADEDLGPAVLEMHAGEHAMITGPPRSGKSSLLRVIAQQLRAADPELVLVGVCSERSPLFGEPTLDAFGTPDRLSGVIAAAPGDDRPWVVLVDDAGGVDDEDKAFDAMVRNGRPDLHVIVAGRTDELSGDYGRWTRTVRQSRNGVLLQPNLNSDGGLLGAQLPRRLHVRMSVGRGFVVASGLATLAQVATPAEPTDEPSTEGASGGTSAHA